MPNDPEMAPREPSQRQAIRDEFAVLEVCIREASRTDRQPSPRWQDESDPKSPFWYRACPLDVAFAAHGVTTTQAVVSGGKPGGSHAQRHGPVIHAALGIMQATHSSFPPDRALVAAELYWERKGALKT